MFLWHIRTWRSCKVMCKINDGTYLPPIKQRVGPTGVVLPALIRSNISASWTIYMSRKASSAEMEGLIVSICLDRISLKVENAPFRYFRSLKKKNEQFNHAVRHISTHPNVTGCAACCCGAEGWVHVLIHLGVLPVKFGAKEGKQSWPWIIEKATGNTQLK